jgi:hypothetical protein
MTIRTRHIRSMLQEALDACVRAEGLSQNSTVESSSKDDFNIERLLNGAITNAMHAAAEIRDESFRHRYGEDGYTR